MANLSVKDVYVDTELYCMLRLTVELQFYKMLFLLSFFFCFFLCCLSFIILACVVLGISNLL